ncbi:inducible T-cell costimulator-like [Xenopus laevis]|uniref:Inducible T-cell costimulator n=2 Tax=Xenopus laevis TaxID=8355 RepID=A0A1L8EPU4_XENLA|nr:inducible T-cell costimulator-like [Xenopus laevis]OCT61341.1 hypothetical protein XELAEV_18047364mg [Xenopus laevis]
MNINLPPFPLFILLVLHAQLSKSYPKVVIASRSGGPYLLCQHVPSVDSKFNLTLMKGNTKQEVCMVYTDGKSTTFYSWNDNPTCNWAASNNSISFTLSNFDVKHTDNYTCEISIFFPPPVQNFIINETYVYIHDLQQCAGMQVFTIWILTGLAVFLFLCCILTFCLWMQKRHQRKTITQDNIQNNECNSEYMPMASVNPAKRPIIPRL